MLTIVLAVGCGSDSTRGGEVDAGDAEAAPSALAAEVVVRDIDGDGRDDTVFLYAAGSGGDDSGLLRSEADTTGDGSIDLWAWVDPATEIAREIAKDTTGNGNADTWELYDGLRVIERRRDSSGNGLPDEWLLYDAAERLTEQRQDGNGDGEPDVWSFYRDDGSTLERVAYDTDGTGQPDRWLNYGEDGELASIQTDTDGDGIADAITTPTRR